MADAPICRKCRSRIVRVGDHWEAPNTGSWCVNESTHEPEGFLLSHTYYTTRRNYDLMRVNEIEYAVSRTIDKLEEAITLIQDRQVPDGEMTITIRIEQRMKPHA